MDPERVVRVRMPGTTPGIYRFGSGYLVAEGLVLTAAHVLVPPEHELPSRPAPGSECEVARADGTWISARLDVAGDAVDVALLRTSLTAGQPPVRWARMTGTAPLRWDALGYPVAGLGPMGREAEHAWGEVSPLTANGTSWLGLTVSSRRPRHTGSADSGWAGLSGAAVVCDTRLAGVITEDPAAYVDSLRAIRADAILGDPGLAAALGSPALDEVGAWTSPGQEPADGPVVLIVDDEDSAVMGGQIGDLATVLTATELSQALTIISNPGVRIDAVLVDICIGEPTGESGRTVLKALRQHRPHVPRSVVSTDPYAGMVGDITATLTKTYGAYRTLRKFGSGRPVADLPECVSAMLRQDDKVIAAVVGDQLDLVRETHVRRLKAARGTARRRRQRGDIEEAELQRAEAAVERAETAVASAREDVAAAEGQDKWQVVADLRTVLAAIDEAG